MEMNENNIDNLFKERFVGYEVSPPEEVWAGINDQLRKKKSKKLIVFWYRFAAGMAILLASSWLLVKITNTVEIDETNISDNEQIITGEKNNNLEKDNALSVQENGLALENKENKTINNQQNTIAPKTADAQLNEQTDKIIYQKEPKKKSQLFAIKKEDEQFTIVEGDKKDQSESSFERLALLDISLNKTTPEAHIYYEQSDVPIIEIKPKRENQWEVGGYYAPLYSYRALAMGESDALANSMMSNAEQGQYTYSGGFSVNYKISDRISIGTGLSVVNHRYEVSNVAAISSFSSLAHFSSGRLESKSNQIYSVNNSIGQIQPAGGTKSYSANTDKNYYSLWAPNESQGALANSIALPDDQVIDQSFDYMEVPLLLRFKLIDKNLGLHLVSGVSSYFLVNNKVTIKSPYQPDINGKTVDIKTTNLSGSLGLGLNYSLTEKIKLNMEPVFKIFLNSVNTSNSINAYPYTFGIYSGINYNF